MKKPQVVSVTTLRRVVRGTDDQIARLRMDMARSFLVIEKRVGEHGILETVALNIETLIKLVSPNYAPNGLVAEQLRSLVRSRGEELERLRTIELDIDKIQKHLGRIGRPAPAQPLTEKQQEALSRHIDRLMTPPKLVPEENITRKV